MRKLFALFLCVLCLSSLFGCGKRTYIYVLTSEENQNDVMSYTCTYENKFDKKTRTLTFTQIDEQGEVMGYGVATYDEKGRRLTYSLKDSNQNSYLSQEFTYDEEGRETGCYTRMLGSPDCMDYKTWENGVLVGGMLCYYSASGEIESTELYKLQYLEAGTVISYYDTEGALIASAGYQNKYDRNGNLVLATTYADGGFQKETGRVRYAYKRIAIG